jgi:phytanoyl-CoA hydroxylase
MPASWLRSDWKSLDLAQAVTDYRRDGFAHLPGVLSKEAIDCLRERCDDLMLGRVDHSPFFFQQDAPSGAYSDMPLGEGWVGPSLTYRKLEKLERDPVFLTYLRNPLFEALARLVIGPMPITLYRTILMNKARQTGDRPGGTDLPWHQDGGRLWGLDQDPELQLWTAIDDAPAEAGCMSFARGSHLRGLATPLGGAIPSELVARDLADFETVRVPAKAGDIILLHTLVWHASGLNHTEHARRGLSVCLMPHTTRCVRKRKAPRVFPLVFGEGLASD